MRRRIHACHMRRRIRKKVRQYIRKVRNIIKTRRQPLYSLGRVHVWALTCVWPCGCLLAYIASRWGAFLSTSRSRISPSSAGGWCRCAMYMYSYIHTYIHAYMNVCCVCDTQCHRHTPPTQTHTARSCPRERAGPSSIALLLPYGGGPTWHPPSLHTFTLDLKA